jgi:hypothetical protein
LVNLSMTTPPVYEVPEWDEGRLCRKAGYFVLGGSNALRDAVCTQPASGGGFAQWQGLNANMVVSGSIAYPGSLIVIAVPKGSVWSGP